MTTTTPPEMVTVIIDGKTHQFPKGTVLLEACNEALGGITAPLPALWMPITPAPTTIASKLRISNS